MSIHLGEQVDKGPMVNCYLRKQSLLVPHMSHGVG